MPCAGSAPAGASARGPGSRTGQPVSHPPAARPVGPASAARPWSCRESAPQPINAIRPLPGPVQRSLPCGEDPLGHPRGREALRAGPPRHPGSAPCRCGCSASRQGSSANGAHSVPGTSRSASGWTPTGVASTGTSQASASSTARPKPSCSDGTRTALTAFTHSGTTSGSIPPSVNSCAPLACASGEGAIVALARAGRVRGEQHVGRPLAQAELRTRVGPRKRAEALDVHAAGEHDCTPPRCPRRQLGGEAGGRGGEQVQDRQRRGSGQARARVADVGAVDGQRPHPCWHRHRRPRGQAEVRVHDVEPARPAEAPAQCRRRRVQQRAGARWELPQLDLDPAVSRPRRASTWSRDEAAALWMGTVGAHVGEDEGAHAPADRSALE